MRLIHSILNLEKPVIAAINGAAAGAGVSIALACDMIIASNSSILIQSFVKVGLIPDLGSIYFLPRLIGRHRALELMFLGEKVTANRQRISELLIVLLKRKHLMDEVNALALKLADGS